MVLIYNIYSVFMLYNPKEMWNKRNMKPEPNRSQWILFYLFHIFTDLYCFRLSSLVVGHNQVQ